MRALKIRRLWTPWKSSVKLIWEMVDLDTVGAQVSRTYTTVKHWIYSAEYFLLKLITSQISIAFCYISTYSHLAEMELLSVVALSQLFGENSKQREWISDKVIRCVMTWLHGEVKRTKSPELFFFVNYRFWCHWKEVRSTNFFKCLNILVKKSTFSISKWSMFWKKKLFLKNQEFTFSIYVTMTNYKLQRH